MVRKTDHRMSTGSGSAAARAHPVTPAPGGGVHADAVLPALRQQWPLPSAARPIVVIGAGSIVRDAHLPVYARLGFPVAGVFDVDAAAARAQAATSGIARVFDSLEAALATPAAIFDVAVPPTAVCGILEQMPAGAAVLIQKPMGRDLGDARRIRQICRARGLIAAVNFQLRFAPNMMALRDALTRGLLGDLTDIEVRITLHTPWSYWAFLRGVPRLEVLMHSIHYLDLIRALTGEPSGVYCRGVRHPELTDYADTRSTIILDYGDRMRCSLTMNHTHTFGTREAVSQLKVEGTRGAVLATMGVNLNYPHGEPDTLEFATRDSEWTAVALRGSWFLEAFEGPMANLQRVVTGEDSVLVSSVEDAFHTMALVEACYESSARGATPIVH
jgi:predicted dehydrogenase